MRTVTFLQKLQKIFKEVLKSYKLYIIMERKQHLQEGCLRAGYTKIPTGARR